VAQKLRKIYTNFWQCTLLWLVVINKTIEQKNRIKSLHHNGNPFEQKRRCSNIPGRLHQSPAQLAQELKSIPVDWAVGLQRNRESLAGPVASLHRDAI